MKILLTGATGFIGRLIALRLRREGHQVLAWVRDTHAARQVLGREVELVSGDAERLRQAVERCEAVINLAGAPVAGRRWTKGWKQQILRSRVQLTRDLAQFIAAAPQPPRVFISASAIGYYGDAGSRELDELAPSGHGFLARVCRDWEQAARAAEPVTRLVTLRLGVVLGPGGMLARLLPLSRLGLLGRLGRGDQWVSWVHVDDVLEAVCTALVDTDWTGPVNMVAPASVTNAQLTRELCRVSGARVGPPVPGWLLRLRYGAAASVMLDSQRVQPTALERFGYRFLHQRLEDALQHLVAREQLPSIRRLTASEAGRDRGGAYLRGRRPRYLLTQRVLVSAPLEQVYGFFSQPENLGPLTPGSLSFEIMGQPPRLDEGSVIDYRIRLGPLPMRWRTVIERWSPGRLFVDAQHRGPYACWWHEHHFTAHGDETIMEDRVYYAPPLGWLGRLTHRLFIRRQLEQIFGYRTVAVRLRFGATPLPAREVDPLREAA